MTLMPPNGRDLSPDQLGELKEKPHRKGYDKTATQQQAENEAAVNSLYAGLSGNSAPSGTTFDKIDATTPDATTPENSDPRMDVLARQVNALYKPHNEAEAIVAGVYGDLNNKTDSEVADDIDRDTPLPEQDPATDEEKYAKGTHFFSNNPAINTVSVTKKLDGDTAETLRQANGGSTLGAREEVGNLVKTINDQPTRHQFEKQKTATTAAVENAGFDVDDKTEARVNKLTTVAAIDAAVEEQKTGTDTMNEQHARDHGKLLNHHESYKLVCAALGEELLDSVKNGEMTFDDIKQADPLIAQWVSDYNDGIFAAHDAAASDATIDDLAMIGELINRSPAMQELIRNKDEAKQQTEEQPAARDAQPHMPNKYDKNKSDMPPQNHSNVFESSYRRSFAKKPENTPTQKNTKTTSTLFGSREQHVSWR
jgi:hypothetical protein